MWFDSHCHLNLPGFDAPPAEVWANARRAGVNRAFVPGVDPAEQVAALAALPGVSTGVGLHPFTLERWLRAGSLAQLEPALARLGEAAANQQHVAIGECGWDKPLARRCPELSLEYQTSVVDHHLRLAVDCNLPIVLHVVQTHGLALETLRKFRLPRGGIIHSYSGNAELVASYCRMGFALGFGTQLLKANTDKVVAALRATPFDRIVLETDAPWRVHDGKLPNSPLAVIDIARIVSRASGAPLEVVAERTFENASRIFESATRPATPL